MRNRRCAVSLVVILCGFLLAAGCASKKTPPVIRGTEAEGLPPIPVDLRSKVECVDAPYNVRCASVPSGMNNCLALMRAEADQMLAQLLGKKVRAVYDNDAERVVAGSEEAGAVSENARYVTDYGATIEGNMAFRRHESPVFRMSDGVNYSMRVCVVAEEADYQIWTDMADRANKDQRPDLARIFTALRRDRYGEDPPERKRIEAVEREIGEHFESLWRMSSERREEKR
jgi:hypothetical protein